jgi:N6-adenosine-specific RNA methylase IME4
MAWGFDYKTHMVWRKQRPGRGRGTGYWLTGEHELLLIGTRGQVPAPATAMAPSVLDAPVGKHSEKPERFAELIEHQFPNIPKIELNRRGPARPGWDAWGLEVT